MTNNVTEVPTDSSKNYDEPYRGLPCELRLLIWKMAIPKKITLHRAYNEDAFPELRPSDDDIRPYLNLLLVSKGVHREVLTITKQTMIFDVNQIHFKDFADAWINMPEDMFRLVKGMQISIYNAPNSKKFYLTRESDTLVDTAKLPQVTELNLCIDGLIWRANAAKIYQSRCRRRSSLNANGLLVDQRRLLQYQPHNIQVSLFELSFPSFDGIYPGSMDPIGLVGELFRAVAERLVRTANVRAEFLHPIQCELLVEVFEEFLKIYVDNEMEEYRVGMDLVYPEEDKMVNMHGNVVEMKMYRI